MENFIFSNENLSQEKLAEEEKTWTLAIERTKEAIERDVNFPLIADIFAEIYRRCYPNAPVESLEEKLELIRHPKYEVRYVLFDEDDDLMPLPKSEHAAHTDPATMGLRFSARDFTKGEYTTVNVSELIKTAIHEVLHLATISHYEVGEDSAFLTGISSQVFLEEDEDVSFRGLNEGMTEMIADAIFAEYFARTGEVADQDMASDITVYGLEAAIPSRHPVYFRERLDVIFLIRELQEITGFPYDDICRTLVREYFTNGHLLRGELRVAFKEFPNLEATLESLKSHSGSYDQSLVDSYFSEMMVNEQFFIEALFGRDVIGQYNAKVIGSL